MDAEKLTEQARAATLYRPLFHALADAVERLTADNERLEADRADWSATVERLTADRGLALTECEEVLTRAEAAEADRDRLTAENAELRRIFEAVRRKAGIREGCTYDAVLAAVAEPEAEKA